MNTHVFITGTGTDVGKTYVTACLLKALRMQGVNAGYYKAAVSGAATITDSDAGFVKAFCGLSQSDESMLSYLYEMPVSPHLIAEKENRPVEMTVVQEGFQNVAAQYECVVMEGSGGILCPLTRRADGSLLMLEEVIKTLSLPCLVVADAGLGTINATVLTLEHLAHTNISVLGVILNRYQDTWMQQDNWRVIEALSGVPVVATVAKHGELVVHRSFLGLEEAYAECKNIG